MEWENLDEALPNEITKYDQGQIARLRNQLTHHSNYYRKELTVTNKASCAMLKEIVDQLGHKSGRAQGLGHSITTFDKFAFGDRHVIYILRDRPKPRRVAPENEEEEEFVEPVVSRGSVYGFIKIGHKPLFVMDSNGNQLEVNPLCVLDFYVLEDYQRNGFGKKLFENMLRDQSINPAQLAIDRPSAKFRSFLRKHYGLSKNIPQVNNFVIFEGFFKLNQVRRNRNRLFDDFNDRRIKSGYLDRRKVTNRIHSEPKVEREKTLPSFVSTTKTHSQVSNHTLPSISKPPSIMLQPRAEPLASRSSRHIDSQYSKYVSHWSQPRTSGRHRSQQRINTAFNIFGVRSNFS